MHNQQRAYRQQIDIFKFLLWLQLSLMKILLIVAKLVLVTQG